jgi:hypothetical protein
MVQWCVAAENPPSLSVLLIHDHYPLETCELICDYGIGDFTVRRNDRSLPRNGPKGWHSGDPVYGCVSLSLFSRAEKSYSWFSLSSYPHLFNWGRGLVEDSGNAHMDHPFFDDYWRSKIPRLDQIKCPAYVVTCWGDQGIHTRGTLNGWKQIGSPIKYLEVHPYQKYDLISFLLLRNAN